MVSTGIIFSFTYMFTHFLHSCHPPTIFSPTPDTSPHRHRTCSALLFPDFVEEKRREEKNTFACLR
jgi:hypothetical protein